MRTLNRRRAETKSLRHLSPATMAPRRRMPGCADALLAAALLLALPVSIGAQTRVLVTSLAEVEVSEPATTNTYTVSLSTVPTEPVTVRVESSDTSAATVKPESLVFTADDWSSGKTLTISAKDDKVANLGGARFGTIKHTPSGGRFSQSKTVHVTIRNESNEIANVTFSSRAVSVTEGKIDGGPDSNRPEDIYTVELDTEPTGPVTVTLVSEDVTIAKVSPGRLTFTASNWEDPQTVTVTGVNDRVDNPNTLPSGSPNTRSTDIKHTFSGGGYDGLLEKDGLPKKVGVTVYDEVLTDAKIIVAPSKIRVKENGSFTYSVVLSRPPSSSVRVALGIALGGEGNIEVDPNSLTFGTSRHPWDTPQTVKVTGVDDKVDNNPGDDDAVADTRSATINHTPTGGGYSTSATTTVTVTDNEDAQVIVPPSKNVTEGNESPYSVKLSSMPAENTRVEVAVSVTGGTADAQVREPLDTEASRSVMLTFTSGNWNTAQTVYVVGQPDMVDNPRPREATITHTALIEPGSISYGETQEMQVRVTDDGDTARLIIEGFPSELRDTDAARVDTYLVKLNENAYPESARSVTVAIASSDPTVTVTKILTFTANCVESDPPCSKEVEISILADAADNPWTSKNVAIIHDPSGSGNYDTASEEKRTLKVIDDDDASELPRLSLPPSVTVTEGATSGSRYVVRLPEPAGAGGVGVTLSSDSIIAFEDSKDEGNPSFDGSGEFLIEENTRSGEVWIFGADDNVDNAGGSRSATIKNEADGYLTAEVPVKVSDDGDTAGMKILSGEKKPLSSTIAIEEGAEQTFTVELTSSPPSGETVTVRVVSADPVTVRMVSADPAVTVSQATLTFDSMTKPSDGDCPLDNKCWNAPQEVTVTGEMDDDGDDQSTSVTLTPVGGGYDSVPAKSLTVKVDDDGSKGLSGIPEGEYEVTEGQSTTIERIALRTRPTAGTPVTVTIRSDNSGVVTVKPASLTFSTANWNGPQAVAITGVADAGSKDRFATITFSPSGGGYGSAQNGKLRVKVANDDTAALIVDPAQVTVAEGSTATYKVSLNSDLEEDVIVRVSATDAVGVSPESLTFKAGQGKVPQPVTVTGKEDQDVADGTATITHRSSSGAPAYEGLSASVQVSVTDDDAEATPSTSTVTVTEASGTSRTATYTLKLAGQPTGPVTVAVASSNTSAATVSPTSMTFTTANWDTAQTVTVTAVDNQTDDGASRTATITHTFNGGGFDGVTNTVAVTVTDNDGIVVSSPTPAEIPEAGGTATYTVKLESQPAGSVTVAVKSSDEKAATVSPSTLTFTSSNGTTAQTVTVTGVPDDVDNAGDKRPVTITHTPSGYGTSAEPKTVTVTVKDDDAAPEGITLSVAPSRVEENDGATRITVTATVNGTTRYADAKSITVAVGASDDSATKGTDYQTVAGFRVTIPAGAASGTGTFTLTPVDDTEFEMSETITVAGTLLGVTVTSASITLTDDDTPPTLSIDSPAVQEGAADTTTPLRFTVTLNKATAQVVTVKYAESAGGTAEAGADYEALTAGTLTFAAGDTKKTITVTVKGDDMDEDDETLKVMLSSPTIATDVGTGTGTIRDDDEPPELSIKGATVAEGHAGTTTPLVFTVTKDGATSKEVTVDYKVSGGTAKRGEDYTAPATGTLTFTPDQAARQITITVKGDNVQEDDETIEIALQAPKNATLAAGKSKATGTITDDDVLQTVAKDWMARFGRTAAAATVDAIAIRMNDAATSAGEDHSLTLAGQRMALVGAAPLPLQAAARIEPWEEGATGSITLQDLAEDSAFDLGRSLAEGYLSVWGASSYHQFEKTSEYTLDGNLVSAILGADHAGDHHVAGIALAYHGGGGEYGGIGKDDAKGELTADLYSFHPYVRLTIGDYLHIGGSFGAGTGSMNIKPAGGKEVETSMTMTALGALDARLDLNLSPGWLLAVQADAHTVHMVSAEKKPELPELATATNRIRLGLESSYAFLVGEGMSLAPTVEVGIRHDGGDAETGLGLDAGGGLRFTAAAIGLMVDARGHAVLSNFASDAQTGDAAGALREWGLGGVIRWRPDFGGHGPEVTLAPSYGAAAGGLNSGAIPSLDAEVGYRLPAFGGVLTPYSSAEFAGSGQRSYRAGAHLEFGHAVEVSAEGTYQQSATGGAEQFLTLRARLRQ